MGICKEHKTKFFCTFTSCKGSSILEQDELRSVAVPSSVFLYAFRYFVPWDTVLYEGTELFISNWISHLFLLNPFRNTSFSVSLPFPYQILSVTANLRENFGGSVTSLSCLFCSGDRNIGHSVLCAVDCAICLGCLLSAREQASWVATGQLYAWSYSRYGCRSAAEIAYFPLWSDRAFSCFFFFYSGTQIYLEFKIRKNDGRKRRILQNICAVRFQMVTFLDWSKYFKVLFSVSSLFRVVSYLLQLELQIWIYKSLH
jgi:hypothetical protein